MKMFSVRDVKSGLYSFPFQAITTGTAVREFTDAVNNPQATIHKHVEDYELYEIGSFDESSGCITQNQNPVFTVAAISVYNSNKE